MKRLANILGMLPHCFWGKKCSRKITLINDNACKVMNASRNRKTRKTDVSPVKKVPKVTFEIDKLYAIAFTDRWYPGR